MTTVERIRAICKAKRIPVTIMERDLGFSNGYLNPKKISDVPLERAILIASYIDVPVSDICPDISSKMYLEISKNVAECKDSVDTAEKEKSATFSGSGMSPLEQAVLDAFRAMPEEKRQALLLLLGIQE